MSTVTLNISGQKKEIQIVGTLSDCPFYSAAGVGTIICFNTPGANANAVKEQVIAAMLLASRDLIGGNKWVADNALGLMFFLFDKLKLTNDRENC